jgi:hypothetical protein
MEGIRLSSLNELIKQFVGINGLAPALQQAGLASYIAPLMSFASRVCPRMNQTDKESTHLEVGAAHTCTV